MFKANLRIFTLITNTLAKDKEISDRWRGFKDVADSRHLANRVEREVVEALVAAVREAYPRLSHRYYALKAKWLGKDAARTIGTATRRCPKTPQRTIAWDEARDTVLVGLCRLLAARWPTIARALLRRALDRRAGAARQGAGRLRASDRAVGAPLCAAELPGQAARRDDARARARPRRAPGAGGAEQGALMAPTPLTLAETASRVRRDADLPRAARARPPTGASARRCSPQKVEDMINTVVRQIAFYDFERKVHTSAARAS